MNTIYVALSKNGNVVSGVKGQYAFGDKGSLGRSMGQVFGRGSKEHYDILPIDVDKLKGGQE